tara:strand:- start:21 stop:449 length:429 start_codon:yes stop_codon:yes gene_type:complete
MIAGVIKSTGIADQPKAAVVSCATSTQFVVSPLNVTPKFCSPLTKQAKPPGATVVDGTTPHDVPIHAMFPSNAFIQVQVAGVSTHPEAGGRFGEGGGEEGGVGGGGGRGGVDGGAVSCAHISKPDFSTTSSVNHRIISPVIS